MARPEILQQTSAIIEDGNIAFHFQLPKDGLALHSVSMVNGVPELRFKAFPKVPTILEEDIATVFRLVSEKKRPEFFYLGFPLTHPLHLSRLFMQYSPAWLRWTSVGELLAETDWTMKCLHIGMRTNTKKSSFKAWSATSELEGLVTHLDFPQDGSHPTIVMSCEHAKVQKDNDEIMFPEEPKMKITDGCSSLYSKYITAIYPSVAYHDEPKFLKMQELIKLILAVEWLYNEKGVRVSEEWVMKHTSKPTEKMKADTCLELNTRKKPPYELIPQPTVVVRPSRDVTVRTKEAEMNRFFRTKCNIEQRYGYYDFSGAEIIMFKEDGTPCPSVKCLKVSIERKVGIAHHSALLPMLGIKMPFYLPMLEPTKFRDEILKLLPQKLHNEITFPVSIDNQVDDCTNVSGGMELKITTSFQPCHPLALPPCPLKGTSVIKATVDDYDKLYASEDPNQPIQPEIPGLCEAIIPDVKSWDELFSELSVPISRIWNHPFIGLGEQIADGGVSTRDFAVKEEPLQTKVHHEETQWKDNYKRSDDLLVVRPDYIRAQGIIQLVGPGELEVSEKFRRSWTKGTPPPVNLVFSITNANLEQNWDGYRQTLQNKTHEEHYHGTTLACNITISQTLCSDGNCGVCGISCTGLDPKCIRKNIKFQRFGAGYYLAPNSSKCHDYTQGAHGYRAMLLCDVLPGKRHSLQTNSNHLTGPPHGYDSVYGQVGDKLNYPEIVVYDRRAVMPRYIIIYTKDGVKHPLAP